MKMIDDEKEDKVAIYPLLGHFQSILHKREGDKETIIQVYGRTIIMTY
jgi:hypothetical protein